MNFFKIVVTYVILMIIINGVFYANIFSKPFNIEYDEAFSRDPNYSPVWRLHVDNEWKCVDTEGVDLTSLYDSGGCNLEVGADATMFFLGDSHTGHLRGLLDQLVKNKDVNIFHTYKYSCPYAAFAEVECLEFYENAFDWIMTVAQPGDSIYISYFYRPFVDDWGDYNVPRKRTAQETKVTNMYSMTSFADQIADDFHDDGVKVYWILNGPSPSVAPFVLKDQNRWPIFTDDSIVTVNQHLKELIGQNSRLNIIDLELIWKMDAINASNYPDNCQKIGDRDNHHISYQHAEHLHKYFLYGVTSFTQPVTVTDKYNLKCNNAIN